MKKSLKIFIGIILLLLVMYGAYWMFYLRMVDMGKVKLLISKAAGAYTNPAAVEKVLLKGVNELRTDYGTLSQAKTYAKETNIPIEQVLVDNAIAMAKNYGYIA